MSAAGAPAPGSLAALCSLEGRVALVAGGSGGIGRTVCQALLAAGARVASLDRSVERAEPGTHALACDLTDPDAVAAAVADVLASHGRLDLVVYCVGVSRDGLSWKLSVDDWRTVIATNLDSAFFLLRSVVPALRTAGGGSLVFVSSINGERGKVGQSNYAASKSGLNGLARTAAREVGRFGIRVNVVAPGWIDTPMTAPLSDELRQRALAETALGRVGQPEDVAHAILFLCSGLSRHVTGQVLRVDGGQWIG
ncbi:MAG: SDR family oxidoreductase [Vicinamibacteria bacterium]|nr:SDR family oxidoreductase [Vicinamibacteria bacterium]